MLFFLLEITYFKDPSSHKIPRLKLNVVYVIFIEIVSKGVFYIPSLI
jgi:hypothetical protein